MDFNTILSPLQHSLIAWIAQYPVTTHHLSLLDLTNAQFFFYMLPRVDGFTWSQQIKWSEFTGLATGQKVKRMRIIGRSITRFYYEQLELSLDNLAFNYIQMCIPQGEAEALRLFIAVIGVMMRSKEIRDELQLFLDGLDTEEANLLRIMIDYAYKIGDKMGEFAESPGKRQKKLVSKLQSLEEELQFYQGYTEQLEAKVEIFAQEAHRHKKKSEELQVAGDKLVKKIQSLQSINEDLSKQLDIKTKLQETLIQRLASNRQAAQEIVDRLLLQNQKQRQDSDHYRKQSSNQSNLQKQNKVLKNLIQQKQQLSQDLKHKLNKQSQILVNLQHQLKRLNKQLHSITTENQGLQIKVQLFEKSYPINRTFTFSPEQQSIVYPTRLGDSYLQQTPKQWFTVDEQNKQRNEDSLSQSLTFSIRSGQSTFFPAQKGFLSIKDLQQSPLTLNQSKQNNDPNAANIKLSEVVQQKSIQMTNSQLQGVMGLRAELQLAICTISDLHTSLQHIRKELRKYQAAEVLKLKRETRFASKVQKMFR